MFIYLFIYGSFKDAVNIRVHVASNVGFFNLIINCKQCGIRRSWPSLGY